MKNGEINILTIWETGVRIVVELIVPVICVWVCWLPINIIEPMIEFRSWICPLWLCTNGPFWWTMGRVICCGRSQRPWPVKWFWMRIGAVTGRWSWHNNKHVTDSKHDADDNLLAFQFKKASINKRLLDNLTLAQWAKVMQVSD